MEKINVPPFRGKWFGSLGERDDYYFKVVDNKILHSAPDGFNWYGPDWPLNYFLDEAKKGSQSNVAGIGRQILKYLEGEKAIIL